MLANLKALVRAVLSSGILLVAYFLLGGLLGMWFALPPVHLVVILNSLLLGMVFAISVAFSSLIWDAITGTGEWNRARQFAFGIFLLWIAYVLGTLNSVVVRAGLSYSMGDPSFMTVASRYLGIVAGVLQVTAPDLGNPLFYGRDRKLLWLSVLIGSVVAGALLVLQGPSLSSVLEIISAPG